MFVEWNNVVVGGGGGRGGRVKHVLHSFSWDGRESLGKMTAK